MVKWLQSEPALVAEIRGAYSPESLLLWLPQLRSTGKEASPPTTVTAVEDDDDDKDIAEGILPVDANREANAKLVGAGGVDRSRAVISGGESSVGGGRVVGSGKKAPPTKQIPSEPLVEPVKPLPVKIKEPSKGKGQKEEAYELSSARRTVKERIVNAQPHDPNMVQLPGGKWGMLSKTPTGQIVITPTEAPPPHSDPELEEAKAEVTKEELKVTTLAIMKKVAMSPSTVMGHAYLSEATDPKTNVPFFLGDIDAFVN